MLGFPSFFVSTLLLASLGIPASAAVTNNVPRSLRQTTRREVVERMLRHPDRTWTAKRQAASSVPTCGTQAGGGTHHCAYDDYCSSQVIGTQIAPGFTAASFDACVASCDSTVGCNSATYTSTTRACLQFSDSSPTFHGGRPESESVVFNPNVVESYPNTLEAFPGSGVCGCYFRFYCQRSIIPDPFYYIGANTVGDLADCVALCDDLPACYSATYQFSTGACTVYASGSPSFSTLNPDYESIVYDPTFKCTISECYR